MAAIRVMPMRRTKSVDYKELADVKIPKIQRRKQCVRNDESLYPVKIVQREGARVKIHYVGGSSYDEWRYENDVVVRANNCEEVVPVSSSTSNIVETVQPFSLHFELRYKIKQMLTCSRKASPLVLITMPFDFFLLFNGGLKVAGEPSKVINGNQRYKLAKYQDISHLLGEDWHFRGLNVNGDYAYVELKTVEFYLQKGCRIVEYFPTTDGSKVTTGNYNSGGASYILKFKFVRNYGMMATFGKDRRIFYNSYTA